MSTPNKAMSVAALALAFLVAGGSARAQSTHAGTPPPDSGNVMYFNGGMGEGPGGPPEIIDFVGVEIEPGGKAIANAPFTASFSTQTSQTLADGNHIQRSTTGTLARDSQGRTRRDMTLSGIGPLAASGKPKQVSMINDPVAGTHYMLDPDKKIAHQMGGHGGKGKGHKHSLPGGTAAMGYRANDDNVTTTSLGTQTIGGVAAEGTRTTRTIPAGAMGNEKPIIITSERWYSADLQTVVKTTRSDPRMGETTMQLTEIKRAEPDASLFQVPADYAVQKGGPKGAHHMLPLPPSD
jgi:hypothetical protein